MRATFGFLAFLLLVVPGCAGRRGAPPQGEWASPVFADHPLVGVVYDVRAGRVATMADLAAAAVSADVVLLGEQHDNADHHRLQQGVLEAVVASGRRPALAFEQLDLEDQAAVDAALASPSPRGRDVADAVDWARSGWPDFAMYEPLFDVAVREGLPVRAANLSREALKRDGSSADGLPPLPPAHRDAMQAEVVASHCGHAPPGLVDAMIGMQRRRDAAMADAVLAAAGSEQCDAAAGAAVRGGAVLVCGFAHARADFGVAALLRRERPALAVLSVAFVEVSPALMTPAAYAEAIHATSADGAAVAGAPVLPFDFVLFTPRVDAEDPCEKYRESLEKLRAR